MIKPVLDNIIVEPVKQEEKKRGSLYIPDTAAKDGLVVGTVVAVGDGWFSDTGFFHAMDVAEGEKVLYRRYAGNTISVDDKDYVIIKGSDVVAKVV